MSYFETITQGAPQSSVLGSLLFLIYTNNIETSPLEVTLRLQSHTLNHVIHPLKTGWTKSTYKNLYQEPRARKKYSAKYLGVYSDEWLSWEKHIEYTNNTLYIGIGILKKNKHYVQKYY